MKRAVINWDGQNGTIRVYDKPNVLPEIKNATFESAIVAINYMGTSKDKVLGVIRWGWKNNGAQLFDGPQDISPSFSKRAEAILTTDYPDYKFTKQ